jgi:hypothetical protein
MAAEQVFLRVASFLVWPDNLLRVYQEQFRGKPASDKDLTQKTLCVTR